MSERHDDNDGSDIFWPGYVDATTNLILNLLFLLTILIVAVFMFALELGRSSPVEQQKVPLVSTEQGVDVNSTTAGLLDTRTEEITGSLDAASTERVGLLTAETDESSGLFQETTTESGDPLAAITLESADPVLENIALKREIKRLNMLLAQKISPIKESGGSVKTVDATSSAPKPQNGLDKTLASDFEVMIRFMDEAVEFTSAEREQLLESLKPISATGKASIFVEVPVGFSESKRMGFYRAMSVRNLLIEMNLPQENINVSVVESKSNANASIVKVRSH